MWSAFLVLSALTILSAISTVTVVLKDKPYVELMMALTIIFGLLMVIVAVAANV
jgi:hypothetical protein